MSDDTLFDIDPDWKAEWSGMPDYSHENLQPDSTLLVHFKTKQDRTDFAKLIGQTLNPKTKFIWYPKAEIGTAADKVFTSAKVTPRYPIYIISKGRADSRLTVKAFEWAKVPYHICVEPQEYDAYAAVIDPAKIITLPFSNLGQGGIPARNFVWNHSREAGAARHWIFDDNISGFCRFQDNLKVKVDSGVLHCLIEDFVDRYENVKMAAFNYDYFAPRKQGAKIKPITWNTRCYSGILLSNDLMEDGAPMLWRGRYNEDTDLSLRILKAGWCTSLFNAFLMYKKPTLTMKGGNATELYQGAGAVEADWRAHCAICQTCAQCIDGYDSRVMPCVDGRSILSKDGRWLMAESLREQHTDQTTVERKWGTGQDGVKRWQHQVDYRRFQPQLGLNIPKLREGIVIPEESEYELERVEMPADEPSAVGGSSTPLARSRQQEAQHGPSAFSFIQSLAARQEPEQPAPGASQTGLSKLSSALESLALASPQPESRPLEPETSQLTSDTNEPNDRAYATTFAIDLKARGHRLLTKDGKFFISESSRLTDEDRVAVKTHREALIALAEPWNGVAAASAGVSRPSVPELLAGVYDAERSAASTSLFDSPQPTQTLAQFLGSEPPRVDSSYVPDEIPDLSNVSELILNFATDGLDWAKGAQPVGVTVSTLDGQLSRFLPFAFKGGGNLSREQVIRFLQDIRGKKIYNDNTRFDLHMGRMIGCDFDEQGCTFSDIQHTAALIDDSRGKFRKDGLKPFAIDTLALDYLPDLPKVARVDETRHSEYHASEVAQREHFTVDLVRRLKDVMYPQLEREELMDVQRLEDDVIPAVVEMENNGSPLDVELLEQFHVDANRKHDELLWEVAKECGFAFDHTAKSWQRLFESLGLPPTDGNAEAIISKIDHPTVKKAHLAAQYASLDSKTFKPYLDRVGPDGILRFDINQLKGDEGGTVSGRFSIGYVQQVPNVGNHRAVFGDELFPRRLFLAADGRDYLEADAMQIEQRLLVHYMDNAKIIKEYDGDYNRLMRGEETVSFHKVTHAMVKVYKPDMIYEQQKNFNFAFVYGAKSIKLAVMMGFITEAEGEEIRRAKRWDDPRLKLIKEIEAAYRKMVPEGNALLDRAAHLAKPACDEYCKKGDELHRKFPHRGYVKTLVGRRSRFGAHAKHYIGLNRVLQGTGADIMKRKLAELHKARKHTGLVMRLTVHDSIGGDAPMPETKQRVSEILNAQSYPLKVPILWSVNTGKNWASCK